MSSQRLPRTRGDGPAAAWVQTLREVAPPHTRGWDRPYSESAASLSQAPPHTRGWTQRRHAAGPS